MRDLRIFLSIGETQLNCVFIQLLFEVKMKTKSPYLNHIADYMRVKRYSPRTISTYLKWIASFMRISVEPIS